MKLSELLDFIGDAWVEAETSSLIIPTKEFRLKFFTRLEKYAHEKGFIKIVRNINK